MVCYKQRACCRCLERADERQSSPVRTADHEDSGQLDKTAIGRRGLCTLRHAVQTSMEAILACRRPPFKDWLSWVTMTYSHRHLGTRKWGLVCVHCVNVSQFQWLRKAIKTNWHAVHNFTGAFKKSWRQMQAHAVQLFLSEVKTISISENSSGTSPLTAKMGFQTTIVFGPKLFALRRCHLL